MSLETALFDGSSAPTSDLTKMSGASVAGVFELSVGDRYSSTHYQFLLFSNKNLLLIVSKRSFGVPGGNRCVILLLDTNQAKQLFSQMRDQNQASRCFLEDAEGRCSSARRMEVEDSIFKESTIREIETIVG